MPSLNERQFFSSDAIFGEVNSKQKGGTVAKAEVDTLQRQLDTLQHENEQLAREAADAKQLLSRMGEAQQAQ